MPFYITTCADELEVPHATLVKAIQDGRLHETKGSVAGSAKSDRNVKDAELGRAWMEAEPESVGTLYIDGHMRVYHGQHPHDRLPRRNSHERNWPRKAGASKMRTA